MKARRQAWQHRMAEVDPHRLVFLDESGAKTNMTRLYGRTIGGGRVVDSVPAGHWCTTTMLSSLRLDGSTAAMVIEGATDRDVFDAYVREVLVPTLRSTDIVVLDNLAPHKTPDIVAAIEATGAEVWFLPPYSPDLNPIEKMWSKVKQSLRKARAQSEQALLNAIAAALKAILPTDAQDWFNSCGYRYE